MEDGKQWVTAVIPTYHRNLSVVSKAIDSALSQTYVKLDVVVIDDNEYKSHMSEGIREWCEKNARITYYRNTGTSGACAARNLGISVAKGEYLAFLDDDDEWMPNKIERQMQYMQDGISMVYCMGLRVNLCTNPPQKALYRTPQRFKKTGSFSELLMENYIGTTTQFLIRKSDLFKIGGFDEELLARQDYDLCLRLFKAGRLVGVEEILFTHYMHEGEQISKSSANSLQGYLHLYRKYRPYYQKEPIAKCQIFWKISRMQRLKGKSLLCILYYIKSIQCNPQMWKKGLVEIKNSKPV